MKVTFLEAPGLILTKRFARGDDGQIQATAYPHAFRFTSHEYHPRNLEEFYQALVHNADRGRCLLKGNVQRPLENESRAGSTNPIEATNFRVYDLDFEDGFDDPDDFLAQIGQEGVSYVFQHSASAGITKDAGLRGHIFLMEEEPKAPGVLKDEVTDLNFRIEALADQLDLSVNGLTLKYPLDVSVNQNDKLIFIAPPILEEGVEDGLEGHRIELRIRERATARPHPWTVNAQTNQSRKEATIERLRKDRGLRKRTARYKTVGDLQVMTNPEGMTITDWKTERGFHYFNINGGDSNAYFTPIDKPDIIRNFKGEPPFFTEKANPELYTQLKRIAKEQRLSPNGRVPIAFHDPMTDRYYTGFADEAKQEVTLYPVSTRQKIVDFLVSNGEEPPEAVEDWTVDFDPTTTQQVSIKERWLNLFRPSPYMRQEYETAPADVPPYIKEVLFHALGSDQEAYDHFLNWLAVIFQHRTKTGTAWLLHGNTGTGKGVVFNEILRPLLGGEQVMEITLAQLEDQFNDWVRNRLVVLCDDNRLGDAQNESKVMDKIKNLITEPHITIRSMRSNPVEVKTYNNMLFTSNHIDAMSLPENDRRFNIAPAQTKQLDTTGIDEFRDVIEPELNDFAAFLRHFEADVKKAREVLKNEARAKLIRAGQNTVDAFFRAALEGDLGYFLQFIEEEAPTGSDTYLPFEKAVRRWVTSVHENRPITVTNHELLAAYQHVQNARNLSVAKFSRMCHLHNLEIKTQRDGQRVVRGFKVQFHADRDSLDLLTSADIHPLKEVNA